MPPIAAPLRGSAGASVVNKHPPHLTCGQCVEMRSVLPVGSPGIDKAQICFVDGSGGLKWMAASFPGHVAVSPAVKFVVNERSQPVQRLPIASAPRSQELGDITPG